MILNKSLVWFRRDLRVHDHSALHHALAASKQVYCVFVYDRDILAELPRQDRRVEFIHACVAELDAALRALGGHLRVLAGPGAQSIAALAEALGVDAVYANEDYEPAAIARDAAVALALRAQGRQWRSFKDQVVFAKSEILTQTGATYSVFTPYKRAWLAALAAAPASLDAWPVATHAERLAPPTAAPELPSLAQIGFAPTNLSELAVPTGMSGAAALIEDFIPRIAHYGVARDYPALKGPSYLSTHLRFGTVSIRQLVRLARELDAGGAGGEGAAVWLSELIWREFYAMILFHHPQVVERAFRPAYDAIVWESGAQAEALFAAWCEGRTGYPLVDAAMAQLNRTGYMHNRLRMVAASFLVKDLGLDWRWGERYFALHLNDYDLASNNGGWQWAASTGCDAQPWFRIFNPVTQSEKFDAEGRFIKRYLPQLAALDAREIHAPWRAPAMLLAQKGIRLGVDYPEPIVVHEQAREKTLARYAVVKTAQPAPRAGS